MPQVAFFVTSRQTTLSLKPACSRRVNVQTPRLTEPKEGGELNLPWFFSGSHPQAWVGGYIANPRRNRVRLYPKTRNMEESIQEQLATPVA